jgi:nucleoside-diphosphate-sugar epimerase
MNGDAGFGLSILISEQSTRAMRALVTGATGFIGSHVAEHLASKGYELRIPVRSSSSKKWVDHLKPEYVSCDFVSGDGVDAAVKDVDYIFHLAGVTKARLKEEYFRGNQLGTKNLLAAVLKNNPNVKRFVHVSSQTATGPSPVSAPVTEQSPCNPITTYGVSKLRAEEECHAMMSKIPITITRPPAVYGPRDKDVFEFFSTMNKGLQPMVGFHDTFVSLIYVKDLAKGIVLAGEHPAGVGQTYFISSERFYNWKEVGDITANILGKKALRVKIPKSIIYVIAAFAEVGSMISRKPALINFEKARDMVQDAWTCDITKAKTELGFRESFQLEAGIKETVAWYKAEGWLK